MAYAKFNGVEIPYVNAVSISRTFVGDRARTANGLLRQDVIAIKRAWSITTAQMTLSEAGVLIVHLSSLSFGSGDFWIKEFGPEVNTVPAIVIAESLEETIAPYRDHTGTWQSDARRLSFTVEEV